MSEEKQETRLLTNESPLIVLPKLAEALGLNEAILLQQIHYWIEIAREKGNNLKDGHYWTYNSVKQWQEQFPFWHRNTIQNLLKKLEKQELLIVGCYNKLQIDRTKWYRLNYKKIKEKLLELKKEDLETLETSPLYKYCVTDVQELCNHSTNIVEPLPKTSPEKSSKNSFKNTGSNSGNCPSLFFNDFLKAYSIDEYGADNVEAIKYFIDRYEEVIGKEHMPLKYDTWTKIMDDLHYAADDNYSKDFDLDYEDLVTMMDHYFKKVRAGKYSAENPTITHFNYNPIKIRNMYEAVY